METDSTLLPVRMVNEYVYCPRLFWLEQVASEWADNEHTVQGVAVHRRVDKAGGAIAAPPGDAPTADGTGDDDAALADAPPWHARALWLSDETIGVSGRLDLVEEADGVALPVDTKKGRPAPDGTPWPADDVQLTLQALLLRAAGYRVENTAIWYREVRRRVTTPLTPERERAAREAVAGALACAASAEPPPPLVDSPKCPGCSLNAICQPDEVNLLDGAIAPDEDGAIRRVIPPRVDAIPLHVTGHGARIGLSGSCLRVAPRKGDETEELEIGLAQLAELNIHGSAQITTQAMQQLARAGVPVSFFSGGGWFYGRLESAQSRNVQVRIAQFAAAGTPVAHAIARVLVADKVSNQRTLLRRNGDSEALEDTLARLRRVADLALDADTAQELLAREGEAAARYWEHYSALLAETDPAFAMQGRTRRPPRDATNALLGFGYALLAKDCTHAVQVAALDAFLGVYHTPHHGRPSLALDLMEPFRPLIVDSVVLGVIRRGEIEARDLVRTGQAVAMKDHARKRLIQAYERRMDELVTHPVFGYRITYRQVLSVQARLLARVLTGEIDQMPSFRTR
jgi:CRISPR-associated protein Cas1